MNLLLLVVIALSDFLPFWIKLSASFLLLVQALFHSNSIITLLGAAILQT